MLEVVSLKNILVAVVGFFAVSLLWLFLSYKILDVPKGITVDEAAFGYNGVLLAETGRDQNGRFMPLFVLSIDGKDWRQPITQYSVALAFKLFGNSLAVLKSVSLVFMVVSTVLVFILTKKLFGVLAAGIAALIFATTPIMVIQSHLALDNIAPVPFVLGWLIMIYGFSQSKRVWPLVVAGIALGISFYTYKAMRLVVPVLCVTTVGYLFLTTYRESIRKSVIAITGFSLAVLPFLLAAPFLESLYNGAVFNQLKPTITSYQQFFYTYLAAFDPTFLFIKGDITPYHSTGKHGAFLLATLPLFVIGAYQAVRRRGFALLLLISFFVIPILFSLVGSVYRASRLLSLVPMYTIIASLGFITILAIPHHIAKTAMLVLIVGSIAFNFGDFITYYWNQYPKDVAEHFSASSHDSYRALAQEAKLRALQPYIEDRIYNSEGEAAKYFEAAYFDKKVPHNPENTPTPPKSIFLANASEIDGMTRLPITLPAYHLFINP